jgi:anti-anti-sigma regulatory factor
LAFGPKVVIDLGATTFLDPAAVASLRAVADRVAADHGWLRLAAANHKDVRQVLELTGADRTLQLHKTIDDAIAREM